MRDMVVYIAVILVYLHTIDIINFGGKKFEGNSFFASNITGAGTRAKTMCTISISRFNHPTF